MTDPFENIDEPDIRYVRSYNDDGTWKWAPIDANAILRALRDCGTEKVDNAPKTESAP